MKAADRVNGPKINTINHVILPEVQEYTLDNGVSVYEISGGTQDVIKIELVFDAGRPYEAKKMVSKATTYLMKEGTSSMDSATIAETIDFYGATLKTSTNLDQIRITLFSLKKHVEGIMPIIVEILEQATFPPDEIEAYQRNSIQNLLIDLSKNEVIAYRQLTEALFGSDHPYGYNSTKELYENIERDDLIHHYKHNIGHQNLTIHTAGKIDDSIRKIINDSIGQFRREVTQRIKIIDGPIADNRLVLPSENNYQTAIRFGRKLFNRNHEDYNTMYFLVTILGGYFGSRLMSNLREDKGYTYNIYAGIDDYVHGGYFYISVDVGNEHVENSINEIKTELVDLIDNPVKDPEMTLVKNYLMGNFLNMLDGPLNQSQIIRSLVSKGSDVQSLKQIIDDVKQMDAGRLQEAARKYLNPDALMEVQVGQK